MQHWPSSLKRPMNPVSGIGDFSLEQFCFFVEQNIADVATATLI